MAKNSEVPYQSIISKYSNITLTDIVSLQKGEVVSFKRELKGFDGKIFLDYLLVDHVDIQRRVVSGRLIEMPIGVNAVPIDEIVLGAVDIASWQRTKKK